MFSDYGSAGIPQLYVVLSFSMVQLALRGTKQSQRALTTSDFASASSVKARSNPNQLNDGPMRQSAAGCVYSTRPTSVSPALLPSRSLFSIVSVAADRNLACGAYKIDELKAAFGQAYEVVTALLATQTKDHPTEEGHSHLVRLFSAAHGVEVDNDVGGHASQSNNPSSIELL